VLTLFKSFSCILWSSKDNHVTYSFTATSLDTGACFGLPETGLSNSKSA
jgi:hypothetical protein